ncbi:hypothetical protein BDN70DRAFT_980007 [Pholiota conissans]|uniref:Uncharacterized protein n=1 Tax=Pholiota conissans TaxID=109636 RepID=A0A9P6CV30_9AGAR|nr:hypothetical protein BDN70DRAFT_980007 [Pholiota conissans]
MLQWLVPRARKHSWIDFVQCALQPTTPSDRSSWEVSPPELQSQFPASSRVARRNFLLTVLLSLA